MEVLIVYAHPVRASFNEALKDTAVEVLEAQGHHVTVSDLYAQNFESRIGIADIKGAPFRNAPHNLSEALAHAHNEGCLSDDVVAEQRKIQKSDLIIFQFPLCWSSVPAILKGWFDRVLVENFAFTPEKMLDQGLLKNGILRMTGFEVLEPQMNFAPQFLSHDKRREMLTRWRLRLQTISEEKGQYFPALSDFEPNDPNDPLQGMSLIPEVQDRARRSNLGLTVGQHLGLVLPSQPSNPPSKPSILPS